MIEQYKIEGYGLLDYSQKLQEGILLGYRLNVDKNETTPINFGSFMHVVLEKHSEAIRVVPIETTQEEAKVEPQVQRGRKPKN